MPDLEFKLTLASEFRFSRFLIFTKEGIYVKKEIYQNLVGAVFTSHMNQSTHAHRSLLVIYQSRVSHMLVGMYAHSIKWQQNDTHGPLIRGDYPSKRQT